MSTELTNFKADLLAARTAIGEGDYDTAETSLMQARMSLAAIPDRELDKMKMAYSREDLDALQRQINTARNRAAVASRGFIQRTRIKYVGES